jgi:histone deacetylase 6
MAMDGDEDIVMGDASPTIPKLPSSQQASAANLNGKADPVLGPSPLAQSLRVPVPPSAQSQTVRETSSAADSRPMSPQGMVKPAEVYPGYPIPEFLERADSLIEENSDIEEEEDTTGLPLAQLPSGLCYDVRMRWHCEVRPTADVHPEDPRRIYYIYKELCRAGLVDDPEAAKPIASRPLKRIHARKATEEEISLVHTTEHFMFVQSTKGMTAAFWYGMDIS